MANLRFLALKWCVFLALKCSIFAMPSRLFAVSLPSLCRPFQNPESGFFVILRYPRALRAGSRAARRARADKKRNERKEEPQLKFLSLRPIEK